MARHALEQQFRIALGDYFHLEQQFDDYLINSTDYSDSSDDSDYSTSSGYSSSGTDLDQDDLQKKITNFVSRGDNEVFIDSILEEWEQSLTFRYICRPLSYRILRTDLVAWLNDFSELECKAIMRMGKQSFVKLVTMVVDHPVFQNKSYRKQEEVAVQIAYTLDRLGHYGNGMTLTRQSLVWKRSPGSCFNYFARGLEAILSLKDRVVSWPTLDERDAHSYALSQKGFPGCIGFIDGTTVPLMERPSFKGDFFYDRHGDYSLNLQVVCNKDKKIIFTHTGYS
ncbi:hypothetical protein BGW38_002812, partial [Lunasporangiospora selenospora]